MFDVLRHIFAGLCGQNPDHTWAPGGVPLPFCQRCSGLYASAAVAAIALLVLRPRLSKRFLESHGACLLVMAPLGLHWVPEGPVLRTLSGILFGFGVAAFLWLPLAAGRGWAEAPRPHAASGYGLAFAASLVVIPILASMGGAGSAYVLAVLGCAGAAAFLLLVIASVGSLVLARR